MNEQISPFNPIEHMETQQEVIDYLTDCLHDDDPNTFVVALGYVARHHGMTAIAKETGLTRPSLYKAFSGKVALKWDTVYRVLRALNLEMVLK